MSKKQIDIEINVDNSDVEESKEAFDDVSESTGEFGSALGSLKNGFSALKTGLKSAKLGFTGLKGAIAATGIGLLLLAFTSLISFFTKTKKGAELLETATASLGAAISIVVDVASALGDALVKVFKGDFSGAIDTVAASVDNLGGRMVAAATAAKDLTNRQQELTDNQRAFSVEQAGFMNIIDRLKQQSDDMTLSEEVRLSKLREASAFETALADKRLKFAKEQADIIREQNSLSESTAEDLDRLAEAEIAFKEAQSESAKVLTELHIKEKAIIQTGVDARKAANDKIAADKLSSDEKELAAQKTQNDKLEAEAVAAANKVMQITKESEQVLIDIMQDITAQKIAQINQDSALKIEAILGTSEMELELIRNIEIKKQQDIAAIKAEAAESQRMIDEARIAQEKQNRVDEIDNTAEKYQTVLDIASQANELLTIIGNNRIADNATETNAAIANKKSELKSGLITQAEFDKFSLKAKNKQIDAENKIRKRQFIADKVLSLVQIAINTAVGITKTMATMGYPAGIPLAIAAAATGAISAGIVLAKRFSPTAQASAPPTFTPPSFSAGGVDPVKLGGGSSAGSNPVGSPIGTQTSLSAVGGAGEETIGDSTAGTNQSIRVHVVERDITNTQSTLANIEDMATIGG